MNQFINCIYQFLESLSIYARSDNYLTTDQLTYCNIVKK